MNPNNSKNNYKFIIINIILIMDNYTNKKFMNPKNSKKK